MSGFIGSYWNIKWQGMRPHTAGRHCPATLHPQGVNRSCKAGTPPANLSHLTVHYFALFESNKDVRLKSSTPSPDTPYMRLYAERFLARNNVPLLGAPGRFLKLGHQRSIFFRSPQI